MRLSIALALAAVAIPGAPAHAASQDSRGSCTPLTGGHWGPADVTRRFGHDWHVIYHTTRDSPISPGFLCEGVAHAYVARITGQPHAARLDPLILAVNPANGHGVDRVRFECGWTGRNMGACWLSAVRRNGQPVPVERNASSVYEGFGWYPAPKVGGHYLGH